MVVRIMPEVEKERWKRRRLTVGEGRRATAVVLNRKSERERLGLLRLGEVEREIAVEREKS